MKDKTPKLSGYSPRYHKICLFRPNQTSILLYKIYKLSIHLYGHIFIAICIIKQEFASLLWKSALLHLVKLHRLRQHPKWKRHYLNHQRKQVGQSSEINTFLITTLDHINYVRQPWKVQESFSLHFQGNPTLISKLIPPQHCATVLNLADNVHSFNDQCSTTLKLLKLGQCDHETAPQRTEM